MSDFDSVPFGEGGQDIPLDAIHHLGDLPDGSSEYLISAPEDLPEVTTPFDFNENIAERLDEKHLNTLSNKLLEDIKDDRESRSEWENGINRALKYLGTKVEEFRDTPFLRACGAFDNTMLSALLRSWATAFAELFPLNGLATCKVLGSVDEQKLSQAERISEFINLYLLNIDKPYYKDSERLVFYTMFYGCGFRKVYQDSVLSRPLARFIEPQHLIIDNKAVSLLESPRITQEIFLTKKELILRQLSGVYRKVKIPSIAEDEDKSKIDETIRRQEGINTDAAENKSLFKFYECHVDLEPFEDIDDEITKDINDELPLPYIVTICATSRKVLSIRRNWTEGDMSFKRKNYFVQYQYLPSFGIYSQGIAHLAGSNAITLTSIQRQLIDAATLKNFPGGLRSSGLKLVTNNKAVGPSEFLEVETGGTPIQDSVMLMPYAEPSSVLLQLRKELINETANALGVAETQISENRPDAPVGTTLALLESSSRMQSSIMRSLHQSLSEELELLYKLFAEYFGDTPYPFAVEGNESAVLKTDFNENVRVVPVSDPNLTTSTQRIIRTEALLKLAQTAPQLHDMREAYFRMYKAMNVQEIDKVLPPPQQPQQAVPLDPITEISNAMIGKPIVAAMWQNHPAHVTVKMPKVQELAQTNPQASGVLMANINEHNAMQYVLDMQMQMGIQLPPLEQLQDPNVQNEIAIKAAEVTQQQIQAIQQQEQAQQPIDPNAVMMADIQQKAEATRLKGETDRMKIETEAYKAQLQFESEKEKMRLQKEMADDKNRVTLAVAGMRQDEAEDRAQEAAERAEEDKEENEESVEEEVNS